VRRCKETEEVDKTKRALTAYDILGEADVCEGAADELGGGPAEDARDGGGDVEECTLVGC
jgi:hypothetical protein